MPVLYCCVSQFANLTFGMLKSRRMLVQIKLIATYREHLPPGAANGIVEMEVPAGSTVRQVISGFDIPMDDTSVIVLNGITVDLDTLLTEGDMITAFSAIAGG